MITKSLKLNEWKKGHVLESMDITAIKSNLIEQQLEALARQYPDAVDITVSMEMRASVTFQKPNHSILGAPTSVPVRIPSLGDIFSDPRRRNDLINKIDTTINDMKAMADKVTEEAAKEKKKSKKNKKKGKK
jgi:hypothetical protein